MLYALFLVFRALRVACFPRQASSTRYVLWGKWTYRSMTYSLSNKRTKKYCNRTILVSYRRRCPPPLSRDCRGRGGAMSHSINRFFPFLTIHRVDVEVVSCQACPVDYVFQTCGTGPPSSPLAIHWPLQDSIRKVACSICVPVELHFSLLYYCQQWIVETHNWCNFLSNR